MTVAGALLDTIAVVVAMARMVAMGTMVTVSRGCLGSCRSRLYCSRVMLMASMAWKVGS